MKKIPFLLVVSLILASISLEASDPVGGVPLGAVEFDIQGGAKGTLFGFATTAGPQGPMVEPENRYHFLALDSQGRPIEKMGKKGWYHLPPGQGPSFINPFYPQFTVTPNGDLYFFGRVDWQSALPPYPGEQATNVSAFLSGYTLGKTLEPIPDFGVDGHIRSRLGNHMMAHAFKVYPKSEGIYLIAIVSTPKDDHLQISRWTYKGKIDPTFGSNGSKVIALDRINELRPWLRSVDTDTQGRVIYSTRRALCRLTKEYDPDLSFGNKGCVDINDYTPESQEVLKFLTLTPQDEIRIAGMSRFPYSKQCFEAKDCNATVLGLDSTGAPDLKFGPNGRAQLNFGMEPDSEYGYFSGGFINTGKFQFSVLEKIIKETASPLKTRRESRLLRLKDSTHLDKEVDLSLQQKCLVSGQKARLDFMQVWRGTDSLYLIAKSLPENSHSKQWTPASSLLRFDSYGYPISSFGDQGCLTVVYENLIKR